MIVIVTGIPSQYLVPSVRQFRYWSLGGGGVIVIVTGIPSLYLVPSVRQFRYWSLGGGCHCNRYTKPVPGAIC